MAFGRSYRNMKHLDEDYPDFLKQLTGHAVKTIDAQKGKKGKGKNKGKGGGETDKTDKSDKAGEQPKGMEQAKGGEQAKMGEQAKGKGKTKRIPSPSKEFYEMKAAESSSRTSDCTGEVGTEQGTPFPLPSSEQRMARRSR